MWHPQKRSPGAKVPRCKIGNIEKYIFWVNYSLRYVPSQATGIPGHYKIRNEVIYVCILPSGNPVRNT
jgi:hypothetical protein